MQEKQKVTLYLPVDLHRQLKIRSAIDQEPMSELTEKALTFYLSHSDVVEGTVETSGIGHIHQVYNCPECTQSVVIREGELIAVGGNRSRAVAQTSSQSSNQVNGQAISQDEELVPC